MPSLDRVFAVAASTRDDRGVDGNAARRTVANRRLRAPVVQVVTPRRAPAASHASRVAPADSVRSVVESMTLSMGSYRNLREPSNSLVRALDVSKV